MDRRNRTTPPQRPEATTNPESKSQDLAQADVEPTQAAASEPAGLMRAATVPAGDVPAHDAPATTAPALAVTAKPVGVHAVPSSDGTGDRLVAEPPIEASQPQTGPEETAPARPALVESSAPVAVDKPKESKPAQVESAQSEQAEGGPAEGATAADELAAPAGQEPGTAAPKHTDAPLPQPAPALEATTMQLPTVRAPHADTPTAVLEAVASEPAAEPSGAVAAMVPQGVQVRDSWDADIGDVPNRSYQGRRRRPRIPPVLRARLRIVLAILALLVLAAVVVLPFAMGSPPMPIGRANPSLLGEPEDYDEEGVLIPPVAGSGTSLGAAPTPTPGLSTTGGLGQPSTSATSTSSPSASSTTTSTPSAAFAPLMIEAESQANDLDGPAVIRADSRASGGLLVAGLGRDGWRWGRLTFKNVVVPTAGTYQLTFYYESSRDRTAHISVNGAGWIAVPVAEADDCCGRKSVRVTLVQGRNTIQFTNLYERCPSIDRIVISVA